MVGCVLLLAVSQRREEAMKSASRGSFRSATHCTSTFGDSSRSSSDSGFSVFQNPTRGGSSHDSFRAKRDVDSIRKHLFLSSGRRWCARIRHSQTGPNPWPFGPKNG